MDEVLKELLVPFPDGYIKQKPGKANASYVVHGVVRQRLLDVVGFYNWSIEFKVLAMLSMTRDQMVQI